MRDRVDVPNARKYLTANQMMRLGFALLFTIVVTLGISHELSDSIFPNTMGIIIFSLSSVNLSFLLCKMGII